MLCEQIAHHHPEIQKTVIDFFNGWNEEDIKYAFSFLKHTIQYPMRFYPAEISNWRHDNPLGYSSMTFFKDLFIKYLSKKEGEKFY
ncbi:MAG: hypothetical protein ACK4NC_02355 [Candidatus Gracilibacteria bacterium]